MGDIKKEADKAFTFFGYYESLSLVQQIKIVFWYIFNKKRLIKVYNNYQRGKSIKDSFIHNK